MSTPNALPYSTSADLADRIYQLLAEIDPATWRAEAAASARQALEEARRDARALLERWRPTQQEERLYAAFQRLAAALPDPHQLSDRRAEWMAVRDQLAPAYEAMASALKARGAQVSHLRPTNWTRSVVHLGSGLLVAAIFELVLTHGTAIALATAWCVWAWSLEITRRYSDRVNDLLMRAFGSISRPHERYRVNSATWFGTALLLLVLTTPAAAAVTGLLVLAVGDPVAGFVGRRWGRTKLVNRRSLEGTLAFFGASFAVVLPWLYVFHPAGVGALVALALVGAAAGAVTELLCKRIEDNFAIPVVAGMAVGLTTWLVG